MDRDVSLVPHPEGIRPGDKVTSNNFVEYLAKHFDEGVRENEIADRLDLGEFTPQLIELHNKKAVTPNPTVAELEKFGLHSAVVGLFVPAEKSMTFYLDKNCFLRNTAIGEGLAYSVASQTMSLISEACLPLMEVHTHPSDSFFSTIDHFNLVCGFQEEGFRFIKSGMILTPEMQVLAVVTKETPLWTVEQFRNWHETDGSLSSKEEAEIKRMSGQLQEAHTKYVNSLVQEVVGAGSDFSKINEIIDKLSKEREEESQTALTSVGNYTNKALNANQILASRQLGLKIYTSTDFQHFIAAS